MPWAQSAAQEPDRHALLQEQVSGPYSEQHDRVSVQPITPTAETRARQIFLDD
jgi:hypothetical protein